MNDTGVTQHDGLLDRLEALEAYDVIDTAPEPEFDGIVRIAAALCRAPTALISLVEEDRQWFKARRGFESAETPISQSICRHALASRDVLVIPDLLTDHRTKDNPLVLAPPLIRFYAGAPLITPEGIVIGTICVIDTILRPQGLSRDECEGLQHLAAQVIFLLETRRLVHRKDDLFKRQKKLTSTIRSQASSTRAAQEAGGVGTFELDIATGMMRVTPEYCRIFHVPVADRYHSSTFEALVLPEDLCIRSEASSRLEGDAPPDVEYRIRTPEGIRWISRSGTFERNAEGHPSRMLGAVKDITRSKRASARLQALLDLGDRLSHLNDIEQMAIAAADLMAKAFDATRAGFGTVDLSEETVMMQPEWTAPGIASVAGLHRFEDYGSFLADLKLGNPVVISDVTLDPRTKDNADALLAIDIRVLVNVPILVNGRFSLVVFVHHNTPYQWSSQELAFVRSFGDRLQSAFARVRAEAEGYVLQRELGHRLKNTLAMVQAIAAQTLRAVPDRAPIDAFERRLRALGSAHEVLFERNWTTAPIASVIDTTLELFGVRHRVDVKGDHVSLGPKATLSLSLLLHELATNALKYGSLSNHDGRVAIEWRSDGACDNSMFFFEWRETGGPHVSSPQRSGFGTKLIKTGLAGTGNVELNYQPSGLKLLLRAPLSPLQQADI